MLLFLTALFGGLIVLIWSADRFVAGAAATARLLGMSPLLIGMLVVGFGTSAPEMLISAISAANGASGIALGNAWGSNVANIALILGLSAVVHPIAVQSQVLRIEIPILTLVTATAAWQVFDGTVSRVDGLILVVAIVVLIGWSIFRSRRVPQDLLGDQVSRELTPPETGGAGPSLRRGLLDLVGGLLLLTLSSRILVWGAVGVAQTAGISDLVIGLTIVALGTSLPELASAIAAARKGEDDIALGNVIGSNLFNTLAVVGIGALIRPIQVEPMVLSRDLPVMAGLTLLLFVVGVGWRGRPGRINRVEGAILIALYLLYMGWIALSL